MRLSMSLEILVRPLVLRRARIGRAIFADFANAQRWLIEVFVYLVEQPCEELVRILFTFNANAF